MAVSQVEETQIVILVSVVSTTTGHPLILLARGTAGLWSPACHAGNQMGSNPIRVANLLEYNNGYLSINPYN